MSLFQKTRLSFIQGTMHGTITAEDEKYAKNMFHIIILEGITSIANRAFSQTCIPLPDPDTSDQDPYFMYETAEIAASVEKIGIFLKRNEIENGQISEGQSAE